MWATCVAFGVKSGLCVKLRTDVKGLNMSRSSEIAEKKNISFKTPFIEKVKHMQYVNHICKVSSTFYSVLILIFSCCEELLPSNSGLLLQYLLSYKIQNCKTGLEKHAILLERDRIHMHYAFFLSDGS